MMYRNEGELCPKSELDRLKETKAKNYKKKPITIKAWRTDEELYINTLEGVMKANKGDYIIQGVKGEYYPCKADVFKDTYETEDGEEVSTDD